MRIKDYLLKWFKSKGKDGKELHLGYVLEGEPKTMDDIEKVFKAFDLESKLESFKPLIRSKIDVQLLPASDDELEIGQSKLGGQPDLPGSYEWPKTKDDESLSFLAQLNCAELMAYDQDGLLPKKGLISFFYCSDQEAWGFDPNDRDQFKVIYTEPIGNLVRMDLPDDLDDHAIFKTNQIIFDSSLSLPGWEHESIEGMLSDDETDHYIEISSGSENQLLGYANCVQEPMELECQLVTNGIFCGDPSGYEDPRRKELEEGIEDWILLFQLNSDDDKTGMMWGDEGKLYFWIRKQDLKNRNFDKCWCILQCS